MALDSLAVRVHEQMRADVISCELAPGTFHTEAELAARYGVSKTPVRFALTLMSSENLVSVLPRRGIQITPLALSDLRDTYVLRGLLEPFASSMAAKHRTNEDVTFLHDLLSKCRDDGNHLLSATQVRAHAEFHVAVARVSGVNQLARLIKSLHETMQRIFNSAPTIGRMLKFGDLDAELLEAIARGDSEAADKLTRDGIRRSNDSTTAALLGDHGALPTHDDPVDSL
jgi:DNA-binding GntR family transcriptional regulator